MINKVYKCKITVIKRTLNKDLAAEYLEDEYQNISSCEHFAEGQEFEIDPTIVPNDISKICPHAWIDIYKDIATIAYGGNIPGYREKGTVVSSCTDWFRPVFFKIERL